MGDLRGSEVDLVDIARSASLFGIKPGDSLNTIGSLLGPPSRWQFPHDDQFVSLMIFGNVEIDFEVDGHNVLASVISFSPTRATRCVLTLREKTAKAGPLRVRVPPKPQRGLDAIKNMMEKAGIPYSERYRGTLPDEPGGLMLFNRGVVFFFAHDRAKTLCSVSISLNSGITPA